MEQKLRGDVIADKKFSKGDFVLANSGESTMLIIDDLLGEDNNGENYFDGNYQCAWLDNNCDLRIGNFAEESLIKQTD